MLTPTDITALRAWAQANEGEIPELVLRLLEERAPAAPGPILPPEHVAEVLARRAAIKREGPVLIETRESDDGPDFTYILYTGEGDIAHVAEGAIPERFIRYAKKTAVFLAAAFDDIPALCASHEALRIRIEYLQGEARGDDERVALTVAQAKRIAALEAGLRRFIDAVESSHEHPVPCDPGEDVCELDAAWRAARALLSEATPTPDEKEG